MEKDEIKKKIIEVLDSKLKELELSESDLDFNESLLIQGVLDSISFLEMMLKLETVFAIEIDFSDLDPDEFTSINGLSNWIKTQI